MSKPEISSGTGCGESAAWAITMQLLQYNNRAQCWQVALMTFSHLHSINMDVSTEYDSPAFHSALFGLQLSIYSVIDPYFFGDMNTPGHSHSSFFFHK